MSVVKVYAIEPKAVDAVKKVLEAGEVSPELTKLLSDRAAIEEKLAKAKKKKDHAAFGPLEAIEDELKAIDAKIEAAKKAGNLKINEFARNGYTLRAAKGVGLEGEANYLYIKAPDEAFFKRNEPALISAGAKPLSGADAAKVQKAFESGEEGSAFGMGMIFGSG